jgi:hypothetical protein
MDLEILHNNVPSIKTLHLDRITLLPGQEPQDITPANLVTELELLLTGAPALNIHIQLFKYIYNKYPSVNKFARYSNYAVERKSLDYIRDVYNKGILPLYQRVGYHTNTFYFDTYCEGIDAFKKFDDFGMKLKQLRLKLPNNNDILLVEELAQSQQSKYIQELACFYDIPKPVTRMSSMVALKDLFIDCTYSFDRTNFKNTRSIHFNQLIDACPATLTDLTLIYIDVLFNGSATQKTSIKTLVVRHFDIKKELGTMIQTCFPKLTTLQLEGGLKEEDVTISLPAHHLKDATIKIEHESHEDPGILLKTMYNGKPISHSFWKFQSGRFDGKIHMHKESIDLPEIEEHNFILTINCASVQTFSYSLKEFDDYNRWDVD